jgi:hypothetical protein
MIPAGRNPLDMTLLRSNALRAVFAAMVILALSSASVAAPDFKDADVTALLQPPAYTDLIGV